MRASRLKRIAELFEAGQRRFWRLLGASILYGIAVGVGLVLLIVPGLIVGARGALLAPLIVLEGMPVRDAIDRSVALVRGQTGLVLGTLVVAFLLTDSAWWIVFYGFRVCRTRRSCCSGSRGVPSRRHSPHTY